MTGYLDEYADPYADYSRLKCFTLLAKWGSGTEAASS